MLERGSALLQSVDDDSSEGVVIRVDISPYTCLDACGGDGGLAVTGAGLPLLLVVAGIALIAAGAAVLIARRAWRMRCP